MHLEVELIPIKITDPRAILPHDLGEVVMNHLFFSIMLYNPPLVMLDSMDVVLTTPPVDPSVETICVCMPLLDVGHLSTLFFSSPFQNCQGDDPPF